MENLRILWLDSGECVLFNSLEKRTSNRCPKYVGKVAERVSVGENFTAAMSAEGVVDDSLRLRTHKIIMYIAGQSKIQPYPIGNHDHRFAETLVLCPTAQCNLRCLYCSGSAGGKGSSMMSWTLAKCAINFFFDHTVSSNSYLLQFHGAGEPMVNFEIVKKSVEYARKIADKRGQHLLTRTTTNGVLTEEQAKWVAENFHHVTLSIDGPRDIHDFHRPKSGGKGSYDQVVNTIRLLEQTGVLQRINTVITQHSVERMEEILRHIRSLCKVSEVRLLPMSYCGRCNISGLQMLDTTQFEKNLQQVLPVAKSLNFRLLSFLEQIDYFTQFYCGACGLNMCVAPNGNVSTCVEVLNDQDAGAQEMIVGRYESQKEEIQIDWEKVSQLRTRTYKSLPGCSDCTFRTNCSGYCLVRAARKNGTVMSVDPESCKTVKKVLGTYIQDMADGITSVPEVCEGSRC